MASRPRRLNSSGVARCGARPLALRRVHALRFGVVDESEQVAADAVHRGFDDGEDGRGSDRGVEGVAALLEDAQARRRCQGLARGDDAVAREHDRACRARIRRRPVARALLRISSQERHAKHADRTEDNRSHRISHHSSRIPECVSEVPNPEFPNPESRVPTGAPIEPASGKTNRPRFYTGVTDRDAVRARR